MYYKIACKNQLAPVKFTMTLKDSELNKGRKLDMKIYISLTSKEPNEHDN